LTASMNPSWHAPRRSIGVCSTDRARCQGAHGEEAALVARPGLLRLDGFPAHAALRIGTGGWAGSTSWPS